MARFGFTRVIYPDLPIGTDSPVRLDDFVYRIRNALTIWMSFYEYLDVFYIPTLRTFRYIAGCCFISICPGTGKPNHP
jgi:hypothetical protein